MIKIAAISSPRYSNSTLTLIDVDMSVSEFGDINCSLHADDAAEYIYKTKTVTNGELFSRAEAGEFGDVKPFEK